MSAPDTDRPLILYHGPECADGFCAAWLIRRYVWRLAEFIPVNYGGALPDVAGRDLLIVDFSYKRPVLEAMAAAAKSILVLDHHETARKELAGLDYCLFDMDRSGAELAWAWACARANETTFKAPWLVRYVADRDLWRWKLPNSRAVNAALRSYPLTFDAWDALYRANPKAEYLVPDGEAILRAEAMAVATHVARAREIELDGHKILAVNASGLHSEIAGALAEGRPFGAVWFERDGLRQWSLRSREGGIDVSEIARAHGGGGHKQAAGFEEPL